MNENLNWLKELEDPHQFLDKDLQIVYERCGMDTVINLLTGVPSINVYVSKASVTRAQKEYVRQHFNGNNHKELAVKLGCSEQQVRNFHDQIRKENQAGKPNKDQMKLAI
jgi:Mor family transcriptional regulator